MLTIFDPTVRSALLARVDQLTPDARPRWGKMNVGQMVSHLDASLRMAAGELVCKPRGGPLSFPMLRWLIIYKLPFPKGAPTAPELLAATPAADIAEDRAALRARMEQIAAKGPNGDFPRHPAFGVMPGEMWGVLIHRHVDHHLKQFGV
jgi:hypothetical protein